MIGNTQENFSHAEYKEAANAYFKGVDIGFTTLKGYLTMNALFFTLIGVTFDGGEKAAKLGSDFVAIIPIFALLVSALMALSIRHYFAHLENCRSRCAEIETQNGGALFKRLGDIGKRPGKAFSTAFGLGVIVVLFVVLWGGVAYKIGTLNLIETVAARLAT